MSGRGRGDSSVGIIDERVEIALLNRLILLIDELGLPEPTVSNLQDNRAEAQAALDRMQQFLADRRVD